jgi:hypothetical protein
MLYRTLAEDALRIKSDERSGLTWRRREAAAAQTVGELDLVWIARFGRCD